MRLHGAAGSVGMEKTQKYILHVYRIDIKQSSGCFQKKRHWFAAQRTAPAFSSVVEKWLPHKRLDCLQPYTARRLWQTGLLPPTRNSSVYYTYTSLSIMALRQAVMMSKLWTSMSLAAEREGAARTFAFTGPSAQTSSKSTPRFRVDPRTAVLSLLRMSLPAAPH